MACASSPVPRILPNVLLHEEVRMVCHVESNHPTTTKPSREGYLSAGLLFSLTRGHDLPFTEHLLHLPFRHHHPQAGAKAQSSEPAGQVLSSEHSAISTAYHPVGHQMHTEDAQFTTPWFSSQTGYGGRILHLRQGDPAGWKHCVVFQESTSPQGGIPTLSESLNALIWQAWMHHPPGRVGLPIYNHSWSVEVPSSL